MRLDADHKISQVISTGKLPKYHTEQLIPAGKMPNVFISMVFVNKSIKNTF
jgi:hypothetical protein